MHFLVLFDKECGGSIWFEHANLVAFHDSFLYQRLFSLSPGVETMDFAPKQISSEGGNEEFSLLLVMLLLFKIS